MFKSGYATVTTILIQFDRNLIAPVSDTLCINDYAGLKIFFLNKYSDYLRGIKRDEWVAPMPGRPCLTGL